MRTTNATLLAAQKSNSIDPLVWVALINLGSSTAEYWFDNRPEYGDGSHARVFKCITHEEVFGGVADVYLDNSDGYFNNKSLKGYAVEIYWGEGVTRYSSEMPTFYVISQQDYSTNGKVYTRLLCYDTWNMLSKCHVLAGGVRLDGAVTLTNPTVVTAQDKMTGSGVTSSRVTFISPQLDYMLVSDVAGTFSAGHTYTSTNVSIAVTAVTTVGASAGGAAGWKGDTHIQDIVAALISDWATESIITDDPSNTYATYTPTYSVMTGDNIAGVVTDMLSYTKCGARFAQPGSGYKPVLNILYLDPAPTPDYAYELDTSEHGFKSNSRDIRILVPNRIFTVAVDPYSAIPTYVGSAIDSASYTLLGKYISEIYIIPSIGSQADADARAAAILAREIASCNSGTVDIPIMNCYQELLDWVTVTDARNGNLVIAGRVGMIERTYEADTGRFDMTLNIGNINTSADITPSTITSDNVFPSGPKDVANKGTVDGRLYTKNGCISTVGVYGGTELRIDGSVTPAWLKVIEGTSILTIRSHQAVINYSEISTADLIWINSGVGVILPFLGAAPASPGEGWTYYDYTLHKLRVWDGASWQNCW